MTTNSQPRRRWFQFKLRTLLVMVLLASIGMSWFGVKMQQVRRQRAAIDAIVKGGGTVSWAFPDVAEESRGRAWLRKLLGDDFFTHPTHALVTNGMGMEHLAELPHLEILNLTSNKITDTDLAHVKCLPRLQVLYIISNSITNAGLEHLTGLSTLRKMNIGGSHISDSGVKKLQEALPNCEIYHIPD